MHGKHLAAPVAALGLALTLAACGGGGGGVPTAMQRPAPEAGSEREAPRTLTAADRNKVRTADFEKTFQGAERAANSLPRFGSVTQSTDAGTASASFDGAGLTVTITRADSNTLTLDTADAVEDTGALPDRGFLIPGAARTSRIWGTVNHAAGAATVARIEVTRANGDSSDWLAGGYWLHIAGQNLLDTAPTVTGAEMGAFVDGPELRSHPASLPATGIARYDGQATGAYVGRYGNGWPSADVAPGSTEIGEFWAAITLTADFTDDTISGCLGCRDDLPWADFTLAGVITDAATGEQHTFSDFHSDFRVTLNEAHINLDGTFSAENVALYSARNHQKLGLGIVSQGGSWGGRFSSISVTTGERFGGAAREPRLVAGTFGSRAEYTDGSLVAFVGAFGAGKQ